MKSQEMTPCYKRNKLQENSYLVIIHCDDNALTQSHHNNTKTPHYHHTFNTPRNAF